MTLKFKNSLTKVEYSFEVTDNGGGGFFYSFDIELPEGIDDGEYEYRLYDGEDEKAVGLVRIGDYTMDTVQYENNNGKYKVYNG